MSIDLNVELSRCPLCGFDFVAPWGKGFGKETSLKDSRNYVVEREYGKTPPYCPGCWFGVTAERAPTLLLNLMGATE